jgi:cell division protein FtsQ
MSRTFRQTAVHQKGLVQRDGQRKSRRSRKASLPGAGKKQTKAQRGMPPVLVRNEAAAMPAAVRTGNKARRRYDVALSVPGAEVRLPALPRLHVGWRLLSGLFTLLLAAALYYAWTTPTFQIAGLQVNGIERLAVTDIETALGIEGELVFMLDPGELSLQLQTVFPELSSAKVKVGLPAEVVIEVVERQPVLAWSRDGEEVWVDADGYVFPPRGELQLAASVEGMLPAVNLEEGSEEGQEVVEPGMVQAILKMTGHLPSDARLIYDLDYGLGWNDWRGWQVYFGLDTLDIETKLIVYEALVDNLDSRGVEPELISMEFLHAPYYRVER